VLSCYFASARRLADIRVAIADVNAQALSCSALKLHMPSRQSAWVALGLLTEDQRNDDRAIEAAIARLCRAGFRAIEAGSSMHQQGLGPNT
jgi:hypothetical protein